MYKVFKVESGRFEVYEEDAEGNTVQVLKPDYATPEEANAKCLELNKPVDSVQGPAADPELKPEEEAKPEEGASKSDVESGATGTGSENSSTEGSEKAPEGEGAGTATGASPDAGQQ